MQIQTVGFIGMGLIGGSIAKALRRVHPKLTLIGYNRSKESLEQALQDGTLNRGYETMGEGFQTCDIIFLCAPVTVNQECMKVLKGIMKPGCLLTDVGSVKTTIHQVVQELELEEVFIGGHPMAGSEKFGYVHADDRLLENAYYILTPTGRGTGEQMQVYSDLVKSIGAIPIVLDYQEHDRVTAAVSHLPHLMAYTLVNFVKESDGPEGLMRQLAAGGFRDMTRIAASSPEMWQQICSENRDQVLDMLMSYTTALQRVGEAVAAEDAGFLTEYFGAAGKYRNDMPFTYRGSMDPLHELYVEIADEPGALSIIVTILGANHISIKNLRIRNNREGQDGALAISFDSKSAAEQAAEVLQKYNYTVYKRS